MDARSNEQKGPRRAEWAGGMRAQFSLRRLRMYRKISTPETSRKAAPMPTPMATAAGSKGGNGEWEDFWRAAGAAKVPLADGSVGIARARPGRASSVVGARLWFLRRPLRSAMGQEDPWAGDGAQQDLGI